MGDAPRPHVRIIGMNAAISQAQVAAAPQLIERFASISWDGDRVHSGCFTEVLVPYLERARAAGTTAETVRPRCLPGSDGAHTQAGNLASGAVPRAQPISSADYDAATTLLTERLGQQWSTVYGVEMQGYMTLAAAHRMLTRPDAVIWILDDARPQERYGAWACLGEYKAFSEDACPYMIIGSDGQELAPDEIERLPWFAMSAADLCWA